MAENELEIVTIQVKEFKVLIEALKEVLTEANIIFDDHGMRICALEKNRTLLVHLRLIAEHFEKYHCAKPFNVGIEMQELYKIMKALGNNDTLTIFMKTSSSDNIYFRFTNAEMHKVVTVNMGTKDLDFEDIQMPPINFDSTILMPSGEFQKTCRYLKTFSNKIEITSVNNSINFSCKDSIDKLHVNISYNSDDTPNVGISVN